MSELLGIRALSRSQKIRIGQKQIKTNVTSFVNLSNPKVRRDLGHHAAIGAFLTVTPLTYTADSGYVLQGGAVSAKATPDMSVNVQAGVAKINDTNVSFSATNKTVTAADATNPRFDIVVVNSSGAVSVVAGTAAATPVLPAVPANSTTLATLNIPAAATAVTSARISDVR